MLDNKYTEISTIKSVLSKESKKAGYPLYFDGNYYTYIGDSHGITCGITGAGKSQCIGFPFIRECITHGESLVVIDPKDEYYRSTASSIPSDYQCFCINLRSPGRSPTKWNPLRIAYELYKTKTPDSMDEASKYIDTLWDCAFSEDVHSDKFWIKAARSYVSGLTYALFDNATCEDEINIDSIANIMNDAEKRMMGGNLLKELYNLLPNDSLSKRNLSTYVTGAPDTRASIQSVTDSDFRDFSSSRGLMKMLSQDTLDICHFNPNKPFVLYIIIGDENDQFHELAGVLISQLTSKLVQLAQESTLGKLPIRVNYLLDELGSVGRSIPKLDFLLAAGRSRNLRLMLLLQDEAQLTYVYGEEKAQTILSNVGVSINFATNNHDYAMRLSSKCGTRHIREQEFWRDVPLISDTAIMAMNKGQALIRIDNRYVYTTYLPFDYQLNKRTSFVDSKLPYYESDYNVKTFQLENFVKNEKQRRLFENKKCQNQIEEQKRNPEFRNISDSLIPPSIDIEAMMREIDEKLAKMVEEEKKSKKTTESDKKQCDVIVYDLGRNPEKCIRILNRFTGSSLNEIRKNTEMYPAYFHFDDLEQGQKCYDALMELSCIVDLEIDK